jgi:hypothetical protein
MYPKNLAVIPNLIVMQARLGYNQPGNTRSAQQADEHGLEDFDASFRGDDTCNRGEDGSADLPEQEDESYTS